jgi:hypothetical protein
MPQDKEAKAWSPNRGQVALLEVVGSDSNVPLTGLVLESDGEILIDLGASPQPIEAEFDVLGSFFAPEALYRVDGHAARRGASLISLDIRGVEAVQRRQAPRVRVALPVQLSAIDEPVYVTNRGARTVDLSPGGCRLISDERLPEGLDPAIIISLPDNTQVIAVGRVLAETKAADGWNYRVAFANISDQDADRLSGLEDMDDLAS